jgi:hypothetical protein
LFVADWQPGDVRLLTALLDKLRNSMPPSLRRSSSCVRSADAGQALPDGISRAD